MQRHSAIISTFIILPFVIKIFVLSIFEWLFYTGFTVYIFIVCMKIGVYPDQLASKVGGQRAQLLCKSAYNSGHKPYKLL